MEPTDERVSFSGIQNLLIGSIYMPIKGGKFNLAIINTKNNDSFFVHIAQAPSTLIRFQTETKQNCVHTYRFRIVLARPHYNADQERSHMAASLRHFWILTVEWSGVRSCLFWWRHRFQIASFSPSTLQNSVFRKHRFQIAPLWRAFSNSFVFGNRFRRCSVDDSRIRSKTAPFSFKNG